MSENALEQFELAPNSEDKIAANTEEEAGEYNLNLW